MVTGGHKEGKNEGKPETVRMPGRDEENPRTRPRCRMDLLWRCLSAKPETKSEINNLPKPQNLPGLCSIHSGWGSTWQLGTSSDVFAEHTLFNCSLVREHFYVEAIPKTCLKNARHGASHVAGVFCEENHRTRGASGFSVHRR